MAMSYTTLTGAKTVDGSIAQWINHADTQAAAPSILEEAESFIYRRLRHWRMITKQTANLTTGQDYLALTGFARYLDDKILKFNGVVGGSLYTDRIDRKDITIVQQQYQFDSAGTRVRQAPQIFYVDGDNLNFDSPPDQAYPVLFSFFQQPAALSGSNTTNWLTTYYPRLVRCACMAGASEFMKDVGQGNYDRTYWEQLAVAEIAVAQTESDMQARSDESGAIML